MITSPHPRVRAEVNLAALKRNYRKIAAHVRPASVLSVVKANAYGLGAEPYVRTLVQAGCRAFGVADVCEALELVRILRKLRIEASVQMLSAVLPDEMPIAIRAGVTLPVVDIEAARALDAAAAAAHRRVRVHLKLDTGMGRLGVLADNALSVMRAVSQLPHLDLEGLFTHCPVASDPNDPYTTDQIGRFKDIIAAAGHEGFRFRRIHMAASDAINSFPEAARRPFTHVRAGIDLHGSFDPAGTVELGLESVLTLKARIAQIRDLPAGTTLGYGRTWCLAAPARVATVAAGYADGVPLALTNRGFFLVGGRRCRVLGRVSMDYTAIDVTNVPNVSVGDDVVLLGRQGTETIGPDAWAALKGTHAYDILCSLGPRVRRIYVGA